MIAPALRAGELYAEKPMIENDIPGEAEIVTDEQLEEVAGGFLDLNIGTMNTVCASQISSIVTP